MIRRERPQPSPRWGTKAVRHSFCRWIFSNSFSFHVVRFKLKTSVALLLTEEKSKATFDSRLRLSIEEACRAFEKHLQEGNYDGGNWLHEADSPFEIQITFARYRSKSFLKPITLNGIVQSSCQRTLRGRFNYLNRRYNEAGQWRFCRAKFKIILRSETEKRFWQGAVSQKITSILVNLMR